MCKSGPTVCLKAGLKGDNACVVAGPEEGVRPLSMTAWLAAVRSWSSVPLLWPSHPVPDLSDSSEAKLQGLLPLHFPSPPSFRVSGWWTRETVSEKQGRQF